jgi:predicted amidohydrolase
MTSRVAVAAGHFGRDVGFNLRRIDAIVHEAAAAGADLLVLPHGVLTGYHDHLTSEPDPAPADPLGLPEPVALDGPELGAVIATVATASARSDPARPLVVCFGITEDVDGERANTAVCVDGEQVLGVHRKVHLPAGEVAWYRAGDGFAAVDTPMGRVGLLVDYDKTFPEAARCLALDGAELLVCPCAWPASRTNRAQSLPRDRQRRLFDLYDRARAAENQVWLATANQIGQHGVLRFLGQSKIVRPDGEIVAAMGARAGLAVAEIDLAGGLDQARRRFHHLKERRPDRYRQLALDSPDRPDRSTSRLGTRSGR